MSPMELLLFFFLALAVVKAVQDSFEYWNRSEEDHIPVRAVRSSIPANRKATVSAIRYNRSYQRARRSA